MRTDNNPEHLSDLLDPDVDTIILVPGLDGTAELFYRQTPLLASRFNVVSFPLPDKRNASMSELADDLAELINEVSTNGAIVCGESFGGALSLTLALQHPEIVKGLVIVNSFPYLTNRAELWLAPRLLRFVPWAAMPAVRRFTERRLHSAHTLPEDLVRFRKMMRGVKQDGYVRRLEILSQFDIRSQLKEVTVPTLLLAGTDDKLLPSAYWAKHMGRKIPRSELELLEGYGHCCLVNHDLDLGQMIGEWWDRNSPDPSVTP